MLAQPVGSLAEAIRRGPGGHIDPPRKSWLRAKMGVSRRGRPWLRATTSARRHVTTPVQGIANRACLREHLVAVVSQSSHIERIAPLIAAYAIAEGPGVDGSVAVVIV